MIDPIYDQDGITIYNADCRDVIPALTGVDLLLTDPPYSEQVHNGARTRTDGASSERLVTFESFDPVQTLMSIECSGWLVATMDYQHVAAIDQNGNLTRFGIWVKPNSCPQLTGDRPATGFEAVAICWRGDGRMKWNGGGSRAVWTQNRVNADLHPTQKPVSLFREWVRLFSSPGDIVLDPFMGSGTTLVAAKMEGRRAVGIELNAEYCAKAVERLRQGVLPFSGKGARQ